MKLTNKKEDSKITNIQYITLDTTSTIQFVQVIRNPAFTQESTVTLQENNI